MHLGFDLAVDPRPVGGEAALIVGAQRAGAVIIAVFTVELIRLEYRIHAEQVVRGGGRVVQLLIDGGTQRFGGAKVVGRILALEQDPLSQQSGPEVGLVQIAGHLGRLLGAHRLHPVFGRTLGFRRGGGQHLILHVGSTEEGRGHQGSGTGQQTTTGDQGDPSLNRKRTHATIS